MPASPLPHPVPLLHELEMPLPVTLQRSTDFSLNSFSRPVPIERPLFVHHAFSRPVTVPLHPELAPKTIPFRLALRLLFPDPVSRRLAKAALLSPVGRWWFGCKVVLFRFLQSHFPHHQGLRRIRHRYE